jgi:hypothetical protein
MNNIAVMALDALFWQGVWCAMQCNAIFCYFPLSYLLLLCSLSALFHFHLPKRFDQVFPGENTSLRCLEAIIAL